MQDVQKTENLAPARSGAAGHRARLRERLLNGGAEALADYEVLEYLLFGALARGDTKPMAKALLERFGTLAGVLNAEPPALKQVKGISDASVAQIKIAALVARRMPAAKCRTSRYWEAGRRCWITSQSIWRTCTLNVCASCISTRRTVCCWIITSAMARWTRPPSIRAR